MNKTLLVLAVVLGATTLFPLALAAETLLAHHEAPDGNCASHDLVPFTSAEHAKGQGTVVVHFVNEGDAATGRVCVFDGRGAKRMETSIDFGGYASRDVAFEAPRGIYTYRAEFTEGKASLSGQGTLNTEWCLSHSADFTQRFHVSPDSVGGSAESGGCVPGTLAVGIAGLFGSTGLFVLAKFPHLGAALLYTRLAKPKLLDHAIRSKVIDAVSREPGIHSRELGRVIDGSDGQTAYHLGVLSREKMLTSMGVPGMRHWFITGRFSPEQMRAIVALRDPARRSVYDAVVADPGLSLNEIVAVARISKPSGSRAVRALERAGILERRSIGRTLSVRPLRAPREIYGDARA